jgi:PAS domain S-box-containing protein
VSDAVTGAPDPPPVRRPPLVRRNEVTHRQVAAFAVLQVTCAVTVSVPGAAGAGRLVTAAVVGTAVAVSALVAATAILVCTRRSPPPRHRTWMVIGTGLAVCAVGRAWWFLELAVTGRSPGHPGPGDVVLLGGYLVCAGALLGLAGMRRRGDVVAGLDATVLAIGLGVVLWVLVDRPVQAAASTLAGAVTVAYPAVDVVLLAVAARLVFSGAGRLRMTLLVAWAATQTTADTVTALGILHDRGGPGAGTAVLWVAGYSVLGAAGLVPHRRLQRIPDSRLRVAGGLAISASALPLPVLLLVRAAQGSADDLTVIACATLVLTGLVLARGVLARGVDLSPASRRSLRRASLRYVSVFLVLALVPLVGLTYVAVHESGSVARNEVRDRMSIAAQVSAEYVQEQLDGVSVLVAAYAGAPSLVAAISRPGGPDLVTIERRLAALQSGNADLFAAWLLDPRGRMLAIAPATPGLVGRDFSYRDYVTGLRHSDGPYVSEAFISTTEGNPRAVAVSTTVRDTSGKVGGILVAGYRFDALRAFCNRLAIVQGVTLTVTDARGRVIAGPGSGGSSLPDASGDPRIRRALEGRSGTESDGEPGTEAAGSTSSYLRVDTLGWSVLAEVPDSVALAHQRRLEARVIAAALLLAQLLLAGLTWGVRADGRRRRAESELSEREEHLRGVLEAASDAYVAADADGRVTAWNARAVDIFGYSREEAVGSELAELIVPPDLRPAHRAGLLRVLRGGAPRVLGQRVTLDAANAEGHRFPVEIALWQSNLTGTPQFNAFIRDVTEIRRAEEQIAAARDAAVSASRLKSEFVANMSHEIRTPMNGVLGMTALLRDTPLDAVQRDYADTIAGCAEALLTVIDDILDFSKIEAGKLELEHLDFDPRAVIEDVVNLLVPGAQAKAVEMIALVDPGVPPAVNGDPHRLRQVLTNLVGNAVKYTEEGEIVVHVSPSQHGEPFVHVAVRDTGLGITAEQRIRLFDAFEQADASTTRRFGGTGLGLTISRRLVHLMGGTLGVDSTPGVGSTFFFDVPLPPATAELPPRPRAGRLDGVAVLVVDDNLTNRKVLEQFLRTGALAPTSVGSGPEALSALRAAAVAGRPFPLVVLDMEMPGMDGLAVARAIREDPGLGDPRILLLTSSSTTGQREAADAAGVRELLTKPVRQGQLLATLAQLLGVPDPGDGSGEDEAEEPELPRAPAGGARILVAEDNAVNQQVVIGMLTTLGYDSDVARDGQEAVELVAAGGYDAVLMDCQMPVLDGFAATRTIRASGGPDASLPIIALTASALASDQEDCRSAGMDDFLSKPLRREALAEALARWVRPAEARTYGAADGGAASVPAPRSGEADGDGDERQTLDPVIVDDLMTLGPEFVAGLVDTYLETAPERLEGLHAAAAGADLVTVAKLAHALKGSSAAMAAQHLAALCADIERAAKYGAGTVPDLVAQADLEYARVVDALHAVVPPMPAQSMLAKDPPPGSTWDSWDD